MPSPCVKCHKQPSTVCITCFEGAIEAITLLLENNQAELRMANAKLIFMKAIAQANVHATPIKKTETVHVAPPAAASTKDRTGT